MWCDQGCGIGLATQAGDPGSPLRRYLATHLPNLPAMHGSLVRALQGTTTLRPPGLGPSPMMRRGYPGDIARAMNYRLRLALAADVGLAPARGMALLQRIMPGEWPVLTSGAFALALARLAHETSPHDLATPVALPDPEREWEACGLAWCLGVFDRVGRTGRPPMVPGSGRRCVEGLRDLIVPIGLDDMVGLVRAAGEGPFARLRARAAVPVLTSPGGADEGLDALVGDTLLAFHTTIDPAILTTPREVLPLLCRLVGALLLDDADPRHLALYLTRQCVGVSWPIERLFEICAGPEPPRSLSEHRQALTATLAALRPLEGTS